MRRKKKENTDDRANRPFWNGAFADSFLVKAEQLDWPNTFAFDIWSTAQSECLRITMQDILEYHFVRTGAERLDWTGGLPLDDVYEIFDANFDFWSQRIQSMAEGGLTSPHEPICLEFYSHLFANRKRDFMTRNRDMGIFVVCRAVEVESVRGFLGPFPSVYKIPGSEGGTHS